MDEERFEDDPEEYIMREIEGSETVSRRRCSQDLLKAMCRQFENETTTLSLGVVKNMINEFSADPTNKWSAKDTAVSCLWFPFLFYHIMPLTDLITLFIQHLR